jgi:hypothetical protein
MTFLVFTSPLFWLPMWSLELRPAASSRLCRSKTLERLCNEPLRICVQSCINLRMINRWRLFEEFLTPPARSSGSFHCSHTMPPGHIANCLNSPQMVLRLRPIPLLMGGHDGTLGIYSAPVVWKPPTFHGSLLWFHLHDVIFLPRRESTLERLCGCVTHRDC